MNRLIACGLVLALAGANAAASSKLSLKNTLGSAELSTQALATRGLSESMHPGPYLGCLLLLFVTPVAGQNFIDHFRNASPPTSTLVTVAPEIVLSDARDLDQRTQRLHARLQEMQQQAVFISADQWADSLRGESRELITASQDEENLSLSSKLPNQERAIDLFLNDSIDHLYEAARLLETIENLAGPEAVRAAHAIEMTSSGKPWDYWREAKAALQSPRATFHALRELWHEYKWHLNRLGPPFTGVRNLPLVYKVMRRMIHERPYLRLGELTRLIQELEEAHLALAETTSRLNQAETEWKKTGTTGDWNRYQIAYIRRQAALLELQYLDAMGYENLPADLVTKPLRLPTPRPIPPLLESA